MCIRDRLYSALLDGMRSNAVARGAPAALWFRSALSASRFLRWRLGVRAGKLLLAPIHRAVGRSLDVVASGGAALSPETARDLEAFGWRVAVGYGLTETSPILTLDPPGRPRTGSVGRPIAGVELRLDDADVSRGGTPGASDGLSEVLARGPNVFGGYLGDEEATRGAFTDDGWFRTGDLGCVDDDGYLYLNGRKSSLIVTESGENVWPEAVENAYQEEGAIAEIGVFERDGRLSAVVVPSSGAVESGQGTESAVRRAVDAASRRLPSHQRIGGYVISRHGLERTRLGKVRRHLLPLRYEEESGGPGRGPIDIGDMTEQDRRLLDDTGAAQVWSWFLETYPDTALTLDTSPRFDLGIDSLGWLSLTMSVSRSAGVVLDEGTIVRAATIRDLLHEVVSAGRARPGDVRPGDASIEALLRDPERFLDERQKRALRPHSALEAFLARAINGLVGGLSRWLHDLEVEGLENVPLEAPYLIAPNHVSYLDPFMLAAGLGADRLRDVYWSGWVQAAFSNPIKRGVSRLGKTIPLDPHRAAVSSLALGAAVLKRGHALVWFPEGTRSASGRIERFKPGTGMLLDAHRVPVVPVMIHGAHEAWPVGAPRPRFLPIRVVFGRPLDPDELESRGDGRTPAERISNALREEMLRMAEESG